AGGEYQSPPARWPEPQAYRIGELTMCKRNETTALKEALSALFCLPATVAVLLLGWFLDHPDALTHRRQTVKEDATLEPYTVALPVALPASVEDVPTADLAPLPLLPFSPASASTVAEESRPTVQPTRRPASKRKPAAATVTPRRGKA